MPEPADTVEDTRLDLRPTGFDHPDAVRLITALQAVYEERYGGGDATRVDIGQFAGPRGYFVVGYVGVEAVACGGWRVREGGDPADPEVCPGDAEIKRMFVAAAWRGRGFARTVLAELERTAVAAGCTRAILETGTAQPEAIGLYLASGYAPMPNFGLYRDEPASRCYAKPLVAAPPARPAP